MNKLHRTDFSLRLATLAASSLLLAATTATVSMAKDGGKDGKSESAQAQPHGDREGSGSKAADKHKAAETERDSSRPARADGDTAAARPAPQHPDGAPASTPEQPAKSSTHETSAPASSHGPATGSQAQGAPSTSQQPLAEGTTAGSPVSTLGPAATGSAVAGPGGGIAGITADRANSVSADVAASADPGDSPARNAQPPAQGVLGVSTTVTAHGAGVLASPGMPLTGFTRHLDLSRQLLIVGWLLVNAVVILLVRRHRAARRADGFIPMTLGTHSFRNFAQ